MSFSNPINRDDRERIYNVALGQSVFGPVDFKLFDAADVAIYWRATPENAWSELTGATVALVGAAPSFFNITCAGLPQNSQISVRGRRVHERTTDVTRGGVISSNAVERQFDQITAVLQELRRDSDKAVDDAERALEIAEPLLDLQIPPVAQRANTFFSFGPDGRPAAQIQVSEIARLDARINALVAPTFNGARRVIHPEDFGAIGDGVTDDSAAFAAAFEASTVVFGLPGKLYSIKDIELNGRTFIGQGCVLCDAPGARFILRLSGFSPGASGFFVRDQGNCQRATTTAAVANAGSDTLEVASSFGLEPGQLVLIGLDATTVPHLTFITAVSGNTVTIRDSLPSASASGSSFVATFGALWVATANDWRLSDIQTINTRGGILVMPSSDTDVSNLGSLSAVKVGDARLFGLVKAKNAAGLKINDLKIWGGWVDVRSYTGTGGAGPFSVGASVFLKRDVNVYVDNVWQDPATKWGFSGNAVLFTSGNYPALGAAVRIEHFRDGDYGFVEDQRETNIISGGNAYGKLEVLDFKVGINCKSAELTNFDVVISDTISGTALVLEDCQFTVVFEQVFLGFSSRSIYAVGCDAPLLRGLHTRRVPSSETASGAVEDNILLQNSKLRITIPDWIGEDHQVSKDAASAIVYKGAREVALSTSHPIAAGSVSSYFESFGGGYVDAGHDGWVLHFSVASNVAPGSGQTYTYELMVNNAVAATIVVAGAGQFGGTSLVNAFVGAGQPISVRLATSVAANVALAHRATIVMS